MSDAIEVMRDGDLIAKIIPDLEPESPREWDNLTTIYYVSHRYVLGDRRVGMAELEALQADPENLCMPVYAYIHGGTTVRAAWDNPWECPWDSGQCGIVVITRAAIRKEFGRQRISKKLLAQVYTLMQAEVAVFDQWLQGDVYGVMIERVDPAQLAEIDEDSPYSEQRLAELAGEHVDSCWGFFGLDYARAEARAMLEGALEHQDMHIEHHHYPAQEGYPNGYTLAEWVPDQEVA